MDEVGIFRTTIGIESPAEPGRIAHLPDTLVDTGSEFTWAPRALVESLGITPQRRQQFIVADGRLIEREIGFAIIHAGGVTAPDFVVFAEPTDTALLGVRSLEGLNLRVDVARKRFVDAGPIITASTYGFAGRKTSPMSRASRNCKVARSSSGRPPSITAAVPPE